MPRSSSPRSLMRTVFFLLAVLAAPAALAQPALFSPTPASLALTPEQEGRLRQLQAEPGVFAIDLVRAHAAVLGEQGAVRLTLPGRAEAVLAPSRFERRAADDASWAGRDGAASQAVLVARRGWVTGSVWHDGAVYEVRPLGGGLHALFRLDTSVFRDHDEGALPGEDREDRVPGLPPAGAAGGPAAGSASPTIDVIVAYTSQVSTVYADPVAFAQAAVDASNTASDNSAVQPRLRLVHAYETPGASSGSTATDLPAFQGQTDGTFDEVHALRDQYGADLVALIGPSSSVYGSCGRGYINSSASSAFTVTAYDCAVGNLSFAHELGHNMGLRHNPEADGSTTPYAYGHGKFQDATGGEASWRTVMSYSNCSASPCTRLPQWSNPDVVVRGSASGDRDLRDNARVIDERGATVAAFRASTVSPPVASVSPPALSLTLPVGGTATETVTIANASTDSDLAWSLSLANVTTADDAVAMAACVDGQVVEQDAVDFFTRSTEGSSELGQSLTAPCDGTLTSIATDIYGPADNATWTSSGTLRVYAGAGTAGPELDAIPFDLTVADWDFVEFALTTPVSVNAGDVVTWFFDFDAGALPFTYAEADPYAGGTALISFDGTPGGASTWTGNDMRFRASFGAPTLWVAPSPVAGTVAPGSSAPIAVAFDAADLAEGAYTADLVFSTNDPTQETITVPITLTVDDGSGEVSIVIDGRLGFRYLGAPADGVTVDDLADMNLVRGVPGYYPNARAPNLWTDYDPVAGSWIPALGTGEVLALGHGFRWQMYDKNQGNPNVSLGYEFPVTLSTPLPANTADVDVTLDTDGARFNFLANPFGETLDLTGIATWPGGDELSPNAPLWVYDPETRTWVEDPVSVAPWQAFRAKAKGPRVNGNPRVITIPFSATQPASAARSASVAWSAEAPRLAFSLSGVDAEGAPVADRALSIRFVDGASAAFDADEDTPKFQVPAEAYAQIGARAGGRFLGHDVRPFAAAEIPLAIEARGTESRFTLRWDADALPAGLPVVLVDLVTGREIDVRMAPSYAFDVARTLEAFTDVIPSSDFADGANATDRFVLRIGTSASAEAAITEVELTAIAPNPSTGSARVSFALPEAGPARVTVYDVRGRSVATLVDGPLSAGRHEATLDSGSLAAGVYVVRLEAGGAVVTRQAVVVR